METELRWCTGIYVETVRVWDGDRAEVVYRHLRVDCEGVGSRLG